MAAQKMNSKTDIEKRTEEEIRAILMPRLAVAKTRQEMTRETALVLFFNFGIYPSAKTVHSYTQRGSLTDINVDLRRFWTDLREKTRVKIEAPMLPEEVVNLFSDALARVWETSLEKAVATFDEERQEAVAEIERIRGEMVEANRMRGVAEAQVVSLKEKFSQERDRRETAEKRIERQNTEIIGLQESVSDWRKNAESEANSRREAEKRFSLDLEAERSARTRDMEILEGEIRFAKLQIDAARSMERDLREQLKKEQERNEVEISAYRQRASNTEAARSIIQIECAVLQEKLKELQSRFDAVQAQIKVSTKERARSKPLSHNSRRILRPIRKR